MQTLLRIMLVMLFACSVWAQGTVNPPLLPTNNATLDGSNNFAILPTVNGTPLATQTWVTNWVTGKSYVTAAITNGLASTNWVLNQSYVTASVTNGLASTNWVKAQGYIVNGSSGTLTHLIVSGSIMPSTSNTVDIGSSNMPFRSIYVVGTGSVHVGSFDITQSKAAQWQSDVATTANNQTRLNSHDSRLNAQALTDAELALSMEALATWSTTPYSQYLADYFTDQGWYDSVNSAGVSYDTGADSYGIGMLESGFAVEGQDVANQVMNASVPALSNFTFSCWSRIMGTAVNGRHYLWAQQGFSWSDQGEINLRWNEDDSITMETYNFVAPYDVSWASVGYNTGLWNHVVVTFDAPSSKMAAWVNGVCKGTNAATWTGKYRNGFQTIGLGASYNFCGRMAEVCLWSSALAESEIATLWNGGIGARGNIAVSPWNSGLVLRYACEEASGDLTDSSGNGYTGTAAGITYHSEGFDYTNAPVAAGVLQSLPWNTVSSNNQAAVLLLTDKAVIPASTNFWYQQSIDGGSTWSNIALTAQGAFAADTNYYRWTGTQKFSAYGTSVLYRAVWSNSESLKLKGSVQYVEDVY